jgi:hypothetical protein
MRDGRPIALLKIIEIARIKFSPTCKNRSKHWENKR